MVQMVQWFYVFAFLQIIPTPKKADKVIVWSAQEMQSVYKNIFLQFFQIT